MRLYNYQLRISNISLLEFEMLLARRPLTRMAYFVNHAPSVQQSRWSSEDMKACPEARELAMEGIKTLANLEPNLDTVITSNERETLVKAIPRPSGREGKVIDIKSDACPLCRLNLKNLNYTDVMILDQFVKSDGSLATFHESKLCTKQYLKVVRLINRARRCNLLKRPADYLVPGPWHDFNTYLEPDRKRDQPMKVIKKEFWKL